VKVVCFGLENHRAVLRGNHEPQVRGRPGGLLQTIKHSAAPDIYKIIGTLPVEMEGRLTYRIKNTAETFERTANENELTLAD